MSIFKALRILNSVMSIAEVFSVEFPENAVLEIIMFIATFQSMILFWNLAWFLVYQMVFRMLTKQAMITILHWGVHLLSLIFQMSDVTLKFRGEFKIEENQFHTLEAKEQCKNK